MRYMVVNRVTEGVQCDTENKEYAYGYCRLLNGPHARQYVVRSYYTNTLGV